MERLVSEVLYWVWDPIGINDQFAARDEYDTYAWQVVALLNQDIPNSLKQEKIADHLLEVCKK